MALTLTSPAFRNFQVLPTELVGDGGNQSPRLDWSDIPIGTVEFALICEDLDARLEDARVHWLVYRIPRDFRSLPESLPKFEELGSRINILQGLNDFGEIGYTGPLPTVGDGFHRYAFTLFALDHELQLRKQATSAEVLDRLNGVILESASLVGLAKRDAAWQVA